MTTEEMKKKLEESEKRAADLEAQVKKFSEQGTETPQVAELKAALDASTKQMEEMKKNFSEMSAERMSEKIARKVSAVNVPSLRTFAAALYSIALRNETKPIIFAEGEKSEEKPMEHVLDKMFDAISGNASKLFAELSHGDGAPARDASDDARQVLSERIGAHIAEAAAKGKQVTFSDAKRIVLDADPALKLAYSGANSAGQGAAPRGPAVGSWKTVK